MRDLIACDMTIYRIEFDHDNYGYFEVNNMKNVIRNVIGRKKYSNFVKTNDSLVEIWNGIDARFDPSDDMPDSSARPDITSWGFGCLVLSEKAFAALGGILSPFGEFLLTPCEGMDYRIFNCQTTANADKSKSVKRLNRGIQDGVEILAFKDDEVDNKVVFKTDFDSFISLYCNYDFKLRVENQKLTGISYGKLLHLQGQKKFNQWLGEK